MITQWQFLTINQLVTFAILAVHLGVLSGCSNPNPNPELLDPIYADLTQRAAAAKSEAEKLSKEIAESKSALDSLPPRDPGLKKARQDLSKKEGRLIQIEQAALYYEIRAGKRKDYDQVEYLKAFNSGKTWPDPNVKANYLLAEKLRSAPREWSKSVPKTDRYNRKSVGELRKAAEEGEKAAAKPKKNAAETAKTTETASER